MLFKDKLNLEWENKTTTNRIATKMKISAFIKLINQRVSINH